MTDQLPQAPRTLKVLLSTFMVWSFAAIAQEDRPSAGTPTAEDTVLGQPAGWALEEPAETLVGVQQGAVLRAAPIGTAGVLARLPEARLTLLEWQGDWVKVRYGELEGWVDLEATPTTAAPIADPARVLHQALEPDPRELSRAIAGLGAEPRNGELAAWSLYTDLEQPSLLAFLERLAAQLVEVYQARYDLSPIAAEERGAVILHAAKKTYDKFTAHSEAWVDRQAAGHAMPGMVVLYAGGLSQREIAATLIHELTHLLNWQTFHRQLPPWLEEGLADDLALVSVDRSDRIVPAPLSKGNLRLGRNLGAMLDDLCRADDEKRLPSLAELIAKDQKTFAANAQQHYAVAAFWVRFLLRGGDDDLANRFRAFLLAVASGQEASVESLQEHLGQDLSALEATFHAWLQGLRERFTQRRKLHLR